MTRSPQPSPGRAGSAAPWDVLSRPRSRPGGTGRPGGAPTRGLSPAQGRQQAGAAPGARPTGGGGRRPRYQGRKEAAFAGRCSLEDGAAGVRNENQTLREKNTYEGRAGCPWAGPRALCGCTRRAAQPLTSRPAAGTWAQPPAPGCFPVRSRWPFLVATVTREGPAPSLGAGVAAHPDAAGTPRPRPGRRPQRHLGPHRPQGPSLRQPRWKHAGLGPLVAAGGGGGLALVPEEQSWVWRGEERIPERR